MCRILCSDECSLSCKLHEPIDVDGVLNIHVRTNTHACTLKLKNV